MLLSDCHNILEIAYENIINKFDVWSEIILIKEKHQPISRQELAKIDLKDIDVLHYFTYAFYNHLLFDYIKEKTKIILTDEGVMTYLIKESFGTNKPINIERISEIWLLDKNLYVSNFTRTLKNIPMEKYLCDDRLLTEMCKELNRLYNYNHEKINSDFIFFDQPITKVCLITEPKEKQILAKIFAGLDRDKIIIKKHPSDFYYKYQDFSFDIIKNDNGVPWELVLLNEYLNNRPNLYDKVFISYYSAALINSKIFLDIFRIPCKVIFLFKFLEDEIKKPVTHLIFKQLVNRFKKLDEKNIYALNSIDELRNIIKNFNK